jgi:MFS family permease
MRDHSDHRSIGPRSIGPRLIGPWPVSSWIILGVGFVVLSLSFSARSALQIAMPLWEQEFGWSRSLVSTGGALALAVIAAISPLAGHLLDRVGVRAMLGLGLVALGVGTMLTSTVGGAPWQFLLVYGGITAVGFGMVSNTVISTMIAWTFTARRGLATGIATSGATAGQLLLVPLLAAFLGTIGWRTVYLAIGLAALLLAVVVRLSLASRDHSTSGAFAATRPEMTFAELWRSPVFHALFWSFSVCGFTTAGVIETHFVPYAVLCGFPPVTGASAYGLLMAVNFCGMILAGWLADRMHRPLLLGLIYILRGVAFLLLLGIADDPAMLVAFAVMFGLFDYSTVPVTASLVASHLGLRVMGLAMGLLAAGHALGGAAGALMGGTLFDLFARYDGVWLLSVAVAIGAGFICFTIRETRAPGRLAPVAA